MRKGLRAVLLLCCAAPFICAAATPTRVAGSDVLDVSARTALAARDYVRVISLYESSSADEMSAVSFYRLAIAYQKTEQPKLALASLMAALVKNPSGSFASTPERLSELKASLESAVVKEPSVTTVASDPILPMRPVVATAGLTPPVLLEPVLIVSPIGGSVQAATPLKAPLTPLEPSGAFNQDNFPSWMTVSPEHSQGVIVVFTLIGLMFSFAIFRSKFITQKKSKHSQFLAAFDARLVDLQKASYAFTSSPESHLLANTELFYELRRLTPVLDREIGRSRAVGALNKNGQSFLTPTDADTTKIVQRLVKMPLKLSAAADADIVALFQSARAR